MQPGKEKEKGGDFTPRYEHSDEDSSKKPSRNKTYDKSTAELILLAD